MWNVSYCWVVRLHSSTRVDSHVMVYRRRVRCGVSGAGCIPESVESFLISIEHVPQVEVQGVSLVPILQLVEVGVLCESHGVQGRRRRMGGLSVLRCAEPAWPSGAQLVSGSTF